MAENLVKQAKEVNERTRTEKGPDVLPDVFYRTIFDGLRADVAPTELLNFVTDFKPNTQAPDDPRTVEEYRSQVISQKAIVTTAITLVTDALDPVNMMLVATGHPQFGPVHTAIPASFLAQLEQRVVRRRDQSRKN